MLDYRESKSSQSQNLEKLKMNLAGKLRTMKVSPNEIPNTMHMKTTSKPLHDLPNDSLW